jgi:hypothetical protein
MFVLFQESIPRARVIFSCIFAASICTTNFVSEYGTDILDGSMEQLDHKGDQCILTQSVGVFVMLDFSALCTLLLGYIAMLR